MVSEEITNQISVINSKGVVINQMEKQPKRQEGKGKSIYAKIRKNRLEAILLRKTVQNLMGAQKPQKKKGAVKGKSKSKMGNINQPDCLIPPHMYFGKPEINCSQFPSSSTSQPNFKINTHNLSDNSAISTYQGQPQNQKEIFVPPLVISAPFNIVPWPDHQYP